MSPIELYLIKGFDIPQMVEQGLDEQESRAALKNEGINISDNETAEQVFKAIRELGYDSFEMFLRINQLASIRDQARLLGVSRHAIAKFYDTYRKLIDTEYSGRG